ncbi:MAG TPA: hypothetical protein VFQ15_02810, partial [Jiangellaceae bacterium]|nr:hypothetical protein [Jiangellaceae bacterium]
MSVTAFRVYEGSYLDSLLLLATTVTMEETAGVQLAGAVMATSKGLQELTLGGFEIDELKNLAANDLVLIVRADDDDAAQAALEAGRVAAFKAADRTERDARDRPARSIAVAVGREPAINTAIISVPGEYAALEAHHALTAGLHVLLFSDGVPIEEEIELKDRAGRLGRLMMGPGAGTAVLAGTGLGFANVMSRGGDRREVGIVAAAGTGAQEVATLLDRWGAGVSQVIGVGGRDLSEAVGGRMAAPAVRALNDDPATDAVLLVSKPPSSAAARHVMAQCRTTPGVVVFLGLDDVEPPSNVHTAPTLEAGARAAAALVGVPAPSPSAGLAEVVGAAAARLRPEQLTVRGLFTGGTLCYEAQVILEKIVGPVYSNEPLHEQYRLPAPDGSHVLLDLGAEEYTRGVPHPMIDPSGRLKLLRELSADPSVAVVVLDVVLGHGAHDDP